MNEQDLLKRITVEADKLSGRPCVRGYRISVSLILGLLSNGASFEELLEDYPFLELADIHACLLYASKRTDHPVVRLAAE
jgi:uncharacterized protein (DUF433 family)